MQLTDPVTAIGGVGESYAEKLQRLNIATVKDLLYHFPFRYEDFRNQLPIGRLQPDETASISGSIVSIENAYTRKGKRITTAIITDGSGTLQLIWFNQTYLTKTLRPQDTIIAAGKVSWWDKRLAIISPFWQKAETSEENPTWSAAILPIYPETEGVTSAWFRRTIPRVWEQYQQHVTETLPEPVLSKYNLLGIHAAISALHFPHDFDVVKKARQRFAFEEMFAIQTKTLQRRNAWQEHQAPFHIKNEAYSKDISAFIQSLPFALTGGQQRAVDAIMSDLTQSWPMNRLLQGDVGAGKTVVAAIAAYAAKLAGRPTFFMAPTEILVEQHVETLQKFLEPAGLTVATITSTSKHNWSENTNVFVGTHALLYHAEKLPQAGLVIIDEQHRFGVEQRGKLVHIQGKYVPHVLTMTATPIPRSLALTIYGDQDLSLIDELPPGRLPTKTWLVPENKRTKCYAWINQQLDRSPRHSDPDLESSIEMTSPSDKIDRSQACLRTCLRRQRQVLVVYPLIEDSEHESMADVKAATTEFKNLSKAFPQRNVALVHGRLKADEKNNIVEQFRNGDVDILVATSLVEVGIDAPNASIIIIENAERFGLATLHQLRGRVGRRGQQGYCFLFSPSDDELTIKRLRSMETHHNGLKLAEIDLELRGPGQVFGTRQHGVGELRFAKITDLALINQTREAVKTMG